MKVIAITESRDSMYGGPTIPQRLLVDISIDELAILIGKDRNEDLKQIKIGTELNFGKIADDVYTMRQFINQVESTVQSLRRHCDEIEKIEIPTFDGKKKK